MLFQLPIIVFDDTGAFGNRVVTHIYALALAAKARVPLVNFCLWRYRRYLVGGQLWVYHPWSGEASALLDNQVVSSPPGPLRNWLATRSGKIGRRYRRWFVHDGQDFCTPRVIVERVLGLLLRRVLARPWVRKCLRPWYTVREYCLNDHKFVLALPQGVPSALAPSRDLTTQMDHLVKPYVMIRSAYVQEGRNIVHSVHPNGSSPLVGVHVRRGDYQVYRGGRWWFSDDVYVKATQFVATVFYNRPCRVILVSQEPAASLQTLIPNSKVVTGDLIQDFCALGACDLIIGPPSTFSGLASYLFETPIYQIDQTTDPPTTDQTLSFWIPQWY